MAPDVLTTCRVCSTNGDVSFSLIQHIIKEERKRIEESRLVKYLDQRLKSIII